MTVSRQKKLEIGACALLGAALLSLYAYLPSAGLTVYASPDETAMAVAAREIGAHFHAYLSEPLAVAFPWLHPRSWVSQDGKITTVGFIGWPMIASVFWKIFGDRSLPWIGGLLILSAAYPFYRLLRRRFEPLAAFLGTLVAFTYPAMILYANRGLFPNAPVLACGLWTLWLIDRLRSNPKTGVASWIALGLLVSATTIIRPVELVWILPWWIWTGWGMKAARKQWIAAILSFFVLLIPVFILQHQASGHWWSFGYLLKDNIVPSASASVVPSVASRPWWLPFGFHPRNILFNMRSFLLGLVWPWMLAIGLAFIASVLALKRRLFDVRQSAPILIAAWTVLILLLVYGNGKYADNIQPDAVTIGNSFLRYLLPLALIVGWSVAYLSRYIRRLRVRPLRAAALSILILFSVALAVQGVLSATVNDAEGLATTRGELIRYAAFREEAKQWLNPSQTVFSDRSDKIFFPAFRAVSPMPPLNDVATFIRNENATSGLFIRPMAQSDKDAWRSAGVDVSAVGASGREQLYLLTPRP